MSTSFIYHGLGIRNSTFISLKFEKGVKVFYLKLKPEFIVCPSCNSKNVIKRGVIKRRLKAPPIGGKPTVVAIDVQRIMCHDCKDIRQVNLGFAEDKKTYTKAFAHYALELLQIANIKDVADHLGVGWDLIKDIQKKTSK